MRIDGVRTVSWRHPQGWRGRGYHPAAWHCWAFRWAAQCHPLSAGGIPRGWPLAARFDQLEGERYAREQEQAGRHTARAHGDHHGGGRCECRDGSRGSGGHVPEDRRHQRRINGSKAQRRDRRAVVVVGSRRSVAEQSRCSAAPRRPAEGGLRAIHHSDERHRRCIAIAHGECCTRQQHTERDVGIASKRRRGGGLSRRHDERRHHLGHKHRRELRRADGIRNAQLFVRARELQAR